jgi:hypothetical protein
MGRNPEALDQFKEFRLDWATADANAPEVTTCALMMSALGK